MTCKGKWKNTVFHCTVLTLVLRIDINAHIWFCTCVFTGFYQWGFLGGELLGFLGFICNVNIPFFEEHFPMNSYIPNKK